MDNHNADECFRRKRRCNLCKKRGYYQSSCPTAQVYALDGKHKKIYIKKESKLIKYKPTEKVDSKVKIDFKEKGGKLKFERKGARKFKLLKRRPKKVLAVGIEDKSDLDESQPDSESEYESYEEVEVTEVESYSESEGEELNA